MEHRNNAVEMPEPGGRSGPGSTQEHITAFWSTVAPSYQDHGGNVAEYGSAGYRRWVAVLAAALPERAADVLDVGAGSGYLALAGASLGHRVTAIDLSDEMLDVLRDAAAARGLSLDVRVGDAVQPDFPPSSFDVVASRHLLWTLREPVRAMANWYALLRPGGRILAVDGFWFSHGDDAEVPPLFAEHYTAETRADLPFLHLDGPGPILECLSAAGFAEPRAEAHPDLDVGGGVPWLITATRP